MTSRIRYRRSCDRCHDQKLRCKRDNDSSACQRCTRSKAKCTFSAVTQSKPPGSFVPSNYSPLDLSVDTPAEARYLPTPQDDFASLGVEDMNWDFLGTGVFDEVPLVAHEESSVEGLVRMVADLNAESYVFTNSIPSVEDCLNEEGEYRPVARREFALDQMLKLSQRFIDVLSKLFTATKSTTSTVDAASELLIVSTYMRVIETYQLLLQHTSQCAKGHLQTAKAPEHAEVTESFYKLPALMVGGFTMESSTATHAELVVGMVEAMMGRERVLLRGILKGAVAKAALEAFGERDGETRALVGRVKRFLGEVAKVQWEGP